MNANGRAGQVRAYYDAYAADDRTTVEGLLTEGFTFSSPIDVGIDAPTYFERCWPNSREVMGFEMKRLHEVGDEVVATYESAKADGSRFRNTEVFGFDGDRIRSVEVYFGWTL